MKFFIIMLLFLESYFLYGQVHFITSFNAFGNYNLKGKTFYVESGDPQIDSNDLEFQYYRDIITQMLIRQKAIPTKDYNNADMCVLLDYHLTDESYQAIESRPVWGETGVRSITTTSSTTGKATGRANTYLYGNSINTNANAYGKSTTKTTQEYTYNHGIVGYSQETVNVSNYNRVINLYAYDNQQREGNPIMLWKVNAESSGGSNDLSMVFPHMVEAFIYFVGKKSNGKETYSVTGNDPDVLAMKGGVYLQSNVIVNPTNFDHCSIESVLLRCVLLDANSTILSFMSRKIDIKALKFIENTYIIFKGQRYPVSCVATTKDQNQMMGKRIPLSEDTKQIVLSFPVRMNKGDTFDFVAYKDTKETKELFSLKNIILE